MTKEIIKIAPTLTAEERFKLIHPDILRLQANEKPLLTEAEMDAIRTCPRGKVLDEYRYRVLLIAWINMIWLRDWNALRMRVSLFGLVLAYETERAMQDAENGKDENPFDLLRIMVSHLNQSMKEFYAYRESIPLLEQELYGMPFFSEEMKAHIAREYAEIETTNERHNETMQDIFAAADAKEYLQSTGEDVGQHLIQKLIPDKESVEAVVRNLTEITKADIRRRD